MEENEENLVVDTTENVEEPTTEEVVVTEDSQENQEQEVEEKKYTEKEFNQKLDDLLAKKLAIKENKIRKEYERKYSKTENILRNGLGVDNLEDANVQLEKFYTEQGVDVSKPMYSDREINILANAEAQEIIDAGLDEINEEVNRLAQKGYDNMTKQEKIIFQKLNTTRQYEESKKELAKIGVKDDILKDENFKKFADMFDKSKAKISEIYEMYSKTQPKKEVKPIGSMKSNKEADNGVKEFYTFEEANSFSREELHNNPKLMEAITKSASQWK